MSVGIRVDASDPTPSYEQLRRQLAGAIEGGLLVAGTRLPTVRQLAADLGIAPGTVMRAYAELDAAGLISTRRGGGTTVSRVAEAEPRTRLASLAASYVTQARALGFADGDVQGAVVTALGA